MDAYYLIDSIVRSLHYHKMASFSNVETSLEKSYTILKWLIIWGKYLDHHTFKKTIKRCKELMDESVPFGGGTINHTKHNSPIILMLLNLLSDQVELEYPHESVGKSSEEVGKSIAITFHDYDKFSELIQKMPWAKTHSANVAIYGPSNKLKILFFM